LSGRGRANRKHAMNPLGKTIAALTRRRARIGGLALAAMSGTPVQEPRHLDELVGFGSNPGDLRGWRFAPGGLGRGAPLIVALHGCGYCASDFDLGAGWSALAAEVGAAALFPEQQRANNPLMCFNWFSPEDVGPGRGESCSVRQMIERMILDHDLDRGRVFVVGLSAGGAMAGALLSLYPETFAAGAIIAGLPYGAAWSALDALALMANGTEGSRDLARMARRASRHHGPWPRLTVWHGGADDVVHPSNGDRIVEQWLHVHGAEGEARASEGAGYSHRTWRDRWGRSVVEQYVIDDLRHGAPIDSAAQDGGEHPHFPNIGLSSTRRIAQFWGLLPVQAPTTTLADRFRIARGATRLVSALPGCR